MVLKEFGMLGYPVSMCEAAVRVVAAKRSSAAIADVLIADWVCALYVCHLMCYDTRAGMKTGPKHESIDIPD